MKSYIRLLITLTTVMWAGAGMASAPMMPYFMEFSPAVGMHAGYLPGYPASHGCVWMPSDLHMRPRSHIQARAVRCLLAITGGSAYAFLADNGTETRSPRNRRDLEKRSTYIVAYRPSSHWLWAARFKSNNTECCRIQSQ